MLHGLLLKCLRNAVDLSLQLIGELLTTVSSSCLGLIISSQVVRDADGRQRPSSLALMFSKISVSADKLLATLAFSLNFRVRVWVYLNSIL